MRNGDEADVYASRQAVKLIRLIYGTNAWQLF